MNNWDYGVFWEEAIKQIKQEVSEQEYSMWFNQIQYTRSDEQQIIVSVPSSFYRDQVKQRYIALIENKLLELSGTPIKLSFEVSRNGASQPSGNGHHPAQEQARKPLSGSNGDSGGTKTAVKPAQHKTKPEKADHAPGLSR